jgi:hypothetical protein
MSGATIHEVQPERTRSVDFGFSLIVDEWSSLRRSFVILKSRCRCVECR